MNQRRIVVTERDMEKLQGLIDASRLYGKRDQAHLDQLEQELDRAEVLGRNKVPSQVVTMNSRVRVTDLDSGKEFLYQIVFPRDADISNNKISVLAPIGTALLGYRVGSEIEWNVPGGTRRLRIDAVEKQPAIEMKKAAV
ncbi:MAG TPA: nucleoside diphosphate kinase regulator [Clostridia bacterium]|nr:nucleoside diphosphate kinase regulator [Clostridia bacterium]